MKKVYEKPEIVFENFSLNTNIAASCDIITTAALDACAYEVESTLGPLKIFVAEPVCTTVKPDGYNEICYHVPTTDKNVFTS